jgi:hypothetical protein
VIWHVGVNATGEKPESLRAPMPNCMASVAPSFLLGKSNGTVPPAQLSNCLGLQDVFIGNNEIVTKEHDFISDVVPLRRVIQPIFQRLVYLVHCANFLSIVVGHYPRPLETLLLELLGDRNVIFMFVVIAIQTLAFDVIRRIKVDERLLRQEFRAPLQQT